MSENGIPKFGRMLTLFGVSAVAAFGFFAGLRFVLRASSLFAGLVGIAAFFIALIVILVLQSSAKAQPAKVSKQDAQIYGIDDKALRETLDEAAKKLDAIRAASEKIAKPDVRAKIAKVCSTGDAILEDIRKDPKDLKPAKQFLNYYLDAAMKIVTRYAELATGPAGSSAGSPEVQQSLAKAESVMDTLNESFEKQLAKLKENDVLDLDTEIQVFEKMNEREL